MLKHNNIGERMDIKGCDSIGKCIVEVQCMNLCIVMCCVNWSLEYYVCIVVLTPHRNHLPIILYCYVILNTESV